MKTLNFSIRIKAPAEKVWKTLWEDKTYRKWTNAFSEGSYAVSDWKEGSKILFLSPSGEGMHSIIAQKIPNEYMSFKHLGTVKDGKEQPETKESKEWSGAMENYTLLEQPEGTELVVTMDAAEEYEDYFKKTFPKALESLKAIAEND